MQPLNHMTYQQLAALLTASGLFTPSEVDMITKSCGQATLGCAILSCIKLHVLDLTGNDIDTLISLLTEPS